MYSGKFKASNNATASTHRSRSLMNTKGRCGELSTTFLVSCPLLELRLVLEGGLKSFSGIDHRVVQGVYVVSTERAIDRLPILHINNRYTLVGPRAESELVGCNNVIVYGIENLQCTSRNVDPFDITTSTSR